MISSKVFQFLAGVGLGFGALAAPAHAGVFQASTTVDVTGPGTAGYAFFLPQYSGPGGILGVNLALSGSAIGADDYSYTLSDGITVAPYSNTWTFAISLIPTPPPPVVTPSLELSVTANYLGASVAPCTTPLCELEPPDTGSLTVLTNSTPFSGNANLTDLSDFKGSGSNTFFLATQVPLNIVGVLDNRLIGSATVTETILTSVPEPSTWAMALIGFGILGFAAHSRRLSAGRAV